MKPCPTPTKQRHTSKAAAKEHIRSLYKNGRGNPDYNAYLCRCGAWHVGHSQRRLAKRIRHSLRRTNR